MTAKRASREVLCDSEDQIAFLVQLLESLNTSSVEKARKAVADRLAALGGHAANSTSEPASTAARARSRSRSRGAREETDAKEPAFPGVRMHTESDSTSFQDGDAVSSPGSTINRRKRSSMLLHNSPSSLDARKGLQRRGTQDTGMFSRTLDADGFQELGWKTANSSTERSKSPQPSKRVSINLGARSGKLVRRATALLDKGEVSTVWSSRVHKQESTTTDEECDRSASDRDLSPGSVALLEDVSEQGTTRLLSRSDNGSEAADEEMEARRVPCRANSSNSRSQKKPKRLERTQSSVVRSSSLAPKENSGFLTARDSIPEPVRRYLSLSQEDLSLERSEESKAKFRNVFNELMMTERDFVRDLKIIDEVFRSPMESKKLVTPSEAMVLFGGLNPILQVNIEFLRQLEYISEQMDFMDKIKSGASPPSSLHISLACALSLTLH